MCFAANLFKNKNFYFIPAILALVGCAHGKMGQIDQPLAKGAFDKSTTVYIERINAQNASFSGDKANDTERLNEEKSLIENGYHKKLAEALMKLGYHAEAVNHSVKTGIVITGNVTKVEHGSGAARYFAGSLGVGASNLYTDFKIENRAPGTALSKFQIVASSPQQSGITIGGFIDGQMRDGSEKAAEYITKSNQ